jgi:2-polyprenyl-3-methyl-5-hydroxy-6-metoxy-1,4-benzoquinol methylase
MKCRLLNILVCPGCRAPRLDLQVFETNTATRPNEIESGVLRCKRCEATYPIVGGIPRMLPDSAEEHAAFLEKHDALASKRCGADLRQLSRFHEAHDSTRSSFTFEWLRYNVTDFDENCKFFKEATGLGAPQLQGKLVLEAGCGMGRFMEVAASHGAHVVGLDLSRAPERARKSTRFPAQVDFVQGDLMNPPFETESFDVVYSIGVLHHTPNTRQAFHGIAPLVRPGGRLSVWVYRTFQPEIPVSAGKKTFAQIQEWFSDGARVVTTRLPHQLLHYLCAASVPLGWLKYLADTRPALKYPLAPAMLLPISGHRRWEVRLCDTFDWLAPRFQWKHTTAEVMKWFEEEGFTEQQPVQRTVSVTGLRPMREKSTWNGNPQIHEASRIYAGQQN